MMQVLRHVDGVDDPDILLKAGSFDSIVVQTETQFYLSNSYWKHSHSCQGSVRQTRTRP